jgi:hypothetical protein
VNITLWIVAGLLAVAFLLSGGFKIIQRRAKVIDHGFRWAEDFSPLQVKLIGVAEILGAVGLIAPAALGILVLLTPLAAVGLTLLMIGGVIVHIRRREQSNLAKPIILGALAAALAILRSGPYCF